MNAPALLNQYWLLIKIMLLPAPYMRWLYMLTLAVLVPGAILRLFDYQIVLNVGLAISLILLMTMGMLVPGQMLSLRSSKQIQCLADLRYKLFFIVLGFWLLMAFILTHTLTHLSSVALGFYPVLAAITMALTCVAVLFVLVGSYSQAAQGFVPLFVWLVFFSTKDSDVFSAALMPGYWLVTMVLWLLMGFWWFQWRPKKYLLNWMTLSAAEIQKQQTNNAQLFSAAFSAVPKSLIGSLLIGSSDGVQAWMKREFGQLIFFVATLMLMIYWAKNLPANVTGIFFSIYLFIFICIRGGILVQHFYRNLYRLWMSSNYSRAAILGYLERQYFLLFANAIIPLLLVFTLMNIFIMDSVLSVFYVGYLLLISSLVAAFSFYLGLFVYLKTSANFMVFNWVSPIANIGILGLMVYLNIFWGPNPSHEHADYLWFSGALLILVLLMRIWLRSNWEKVNFYRVKS